MVSSNDGREIGVRRNGHGFVTIYDIDDELTVDHAHGRKLAAALEQGQALQLSTADGQVWTYDGGPHLGRASVGQRHGPWSLEAEGWARVAAQIRRAVQS